MSDAQSEISELLELQRQAQEMKPGPSESEPDRAGGSGEETEDPALSEIRKSMNELSENIESALEDIESVAKEQPVLTAAIAFTLGLVVGQLSSRR